MLPAACPGVKRTFSSEFPNRMISPSRKESFWFRNPFELVTERKPDLLCRKEKGIPLLVVFRPDPVSPFDKVVSNDVIDMAVCIDIPDQFQVVLFDEFCEFRLLLRVVTGGINDNSFTRSVIQQVAVHHEGVEDEYFESHFFGLMCKITNYISEE